MDQLMGMAGTLDEGVKNELCFPEEYIKSKAAIFPEQAKENNTDPDECIWSKLDKIFKAKYPLTLQRFDLLDGTISSSEDVQALYTSLSSMIKDVKFRQMTDREMEAIVMLY